MEPFAAYVIQRFTDDPHVWATVLFDEVVELGLDRSYQSFTRLLRARGLRPHCEACSGVIGRATVEIDHPPGEEISDSDSVASSSLGSICMWLPPLAPASARHQRARSRRLGGSAEITTSLPESSTTMLPRSCPVATTPRAGSYGWSSIRNGSPGTPHLAWQERLRTGVVGTPGARL